MSGMFSKIKNQIKRLWRIMPDPAALWWFLGVLALSFSLALLMPEGGVVRWLLETENKPDTLQLIGWGMGGVLAAIVALALNRRAAAMEKGLIDERFKAAVQSLAGEQPSVRIAAFYQFYYLAKDNPDTDFRSSIFDILCAHLRQITSDADYRENAGSKKPTEECQSLLDVLFKKSRNVFVGMKADMKNAYLVRANLSNTELQQIDFSGADVSGAIFRDANMSGAHFEEATVSMANFENANAPEANFRYADVSRVIFRNANVSGAHFWGAKVLGAHFWNADVSESIFVSADMSGAKFWDANVSDSDFLEANLSGADFLNANVSETNFEDADVSAANFWNANVSYALFGKANLSAANFGHADMSAANFNDADVSATNFEETDLRGADFSFAKNIEKAIFRQVKINASTQFPGGKLPEWFREGEHYTVAKEEE